MWDTVTNAEIFRLNGTQENRAWYETKADGTVMIFVPESGQEIKAFKITDARDMENPELRSQLCSILRGLDGQKRSFAAKSLRQLGHDPCA